MAHERLYPQQIFESLDTDLQRILNPDQRTHYFENNITLEKPWHKVGEINLYKANVIHQEYKLFAKSFAPITDNYADVAYTILQELAVLPFYMPILPVIGKSGRTLFFKAGNDQGTMKWEALPINVREQITMTVERHGLLPLSRFSEVSIIEADGIKFIADPFDDSNYSIDQFIEGKDQ